MGLRDLIQNLFQPDRSTTPHLGTSDAWDELADSAATQQLDEVRATPRPAALGQSYYEMVFGAGGEEQSALWSAEGVRAARPHLVRARGLDRRVAATEEALCAADAIATQVRTDAQHAEQVLRPYVRRDRFAVSRYVSGWVCLGLGDVAGVTGAAVTLGEIPALAVGQAVSIAFAAVTSGQAGADLKDLRLARQRQRDVSTLSEDEQRYRRLFEGMEPGVGIMKAVGWVSLTIVVIVAVAVLSLRLSVEGMTSGLAFGGLAAATALGSFVSTYGYTDDVADLLAATAKCAKKAEKRRAVLARTACFRVQAEADATAMSLRQEYALRGQAAIHHLDALAWQVQANNPQTHGHGLPADRQSASTAIGRRPRRGKTE